MRFNKKKGACFLIGSGSSVNIWDDPWIPSLNSFTSIQSSASLDHPQMVTALITRGYRQWDCGKLQALFDEHTVECIAKVHIPLTSVDDKLIWVHNSNGSFTVKSTFIIEQAP